MNQRKSIIPTLLYIFGTAICILSLLSDLIRGRQYSIGISQIISFLTGLLVLISAWLYQQGKLLSLLSNLSGWFFGSPSQPTRMARFGKIADILILFLFLFYASAYFLGRWGGLDPAILVDKNGDAGALLSYAAAMDAPQNFAADQILNPEQPMYSYNGIYLPYIRYISKHTGDYGLALLTLLPICFFLHLTSFYLLGRELFKNRFWAFLLALLTAVPIVYGFWDSWGLAYDPLPRFVFQSITPFFLLLFLKWTGHPRRWSWLMFGISFFFFIHVISTPGIAFMLWAGFFLFIPKEWTLKKKILFQLLNGLVFAIPFGVFVLTSESTAGITTASGATYAEIMKYLRSNFNAFLNISKSLWLYIQVLNIYMILIPAVLGVLVIYLTKTQKVLRTNLVLIWLAACVFISIVIPSIEHAVENALGIPPIQFDLVRNLRYSIPLLEILGISGFVAIQKRLQNSYGFNLRGNLITVGVCLIASVWVFSAVTHEYKSDHEYGLDFAWQEVRCIATGELFCPTQRKQDEAEALNFIKDELPIDSTFLSMPNDELANEIRAFGMRSVSFTHIDKNRIAYSYLPKAIEIEQKTQQWSDMLKSSPEELRIWAANLSCEFGVSHWFVDEDLRINLEDRSSGIIKVFENGSFSVIELPECQ